MPVDEPVLRVRAPALLLLSFLEKPPLQADGERERLGDGIDRPHAADLLEGGERRRHPLLNAMLLERGPRLREGLEGGGSFFLRHEGRDEKQEQAERPHARIMPALVKAVETSALTRVYANGVVGIAELDMTVERGEVVGLVGPNGSGKTTTIRLLLDFLRPTSGKASVLGLDTRRDSLAIRKQIGFLPGDLTFHDSLTGEETLRLYERLRPETPPASRDELLESLALSTDVLARPVGTYSTGMRRKLGLVVALQHDPTLAILDEPTNGLDPLMRRRCHEAIRRWRGGDRTLFLSTHDILEVDRLCDRVFVVRAGRLVAARAVEEFRNGGDANDLEESILRYYEEGG